MQRVFELPLAESIQPRRPDDHVASGRHARRATTVPWRPVAIQGDGSTDPTFNPVLDKGQSLGSFSGALYYFSGGAQYTIQARCQDDIVPLGQPPIPSNTACVHARTILDTSEGSN